MGAWAWARTSCPLLASGPLGTSSPWLSSRRLSRRCRGTRPAHAGHCQQLHSYFDSHFDPVPGQMRLLSAARVGARAAGGRARSGVKCSSSRSRSRGPSHCSSPRAPLSLLQARLCLCRRRRPPQPLRLACLPLRNTCCTYRCLLALCGATLAVARRSARCLALRRAFHFGLCCGRVVYPSLSLSLLGRIKVVARVQRNAKAGSQFLTWAWQTRRHHDRQEQSCTDHDQPIHLPSAQSSQHQ